MNWLLKVGVVASALALAGLCELAPQADGGIAGDLTGMRIVAHQFAAHLTGPNKHSSINDPSKARFLILKVTAKAPLGGTRVWAQDFVLVYHHTDGSEDRSRCHGIAEVDYKSVPEGDIRFFRNGDVGSVTCEGQDARFALAFYVEPDVRTVQLHPIGGQPLVYDIGHSRPYSVAIVTNCAPERLPKAKAAAQQAGLQVVQVSSGLRHDETGVTIM
ncbi:MAG: hypothetical protein FJ290_15655 [Planctomycetes bacterium]|nr:hypothetical protein [Planctomycetota bacterium]